MIIITTSLLCPCLVIPSLLSISPSFLYLRELSQSLDIFQFFCCYKGVSLSLIPSFVPCTTFSCLDCPFFRVGMFAFVDTGSPRMMG